MDFQDFPLLEHLNGTQRQNLQAACDFTEFPSGHRLIEQAQQGNTLFFLLKGSVEVRVKVDSREHVVASLEAPAILGEMELLTGVPRSASVDAKTTVCCALLDSSVLRARIDDGDPAALKFVYKVAQVLAQRVAAVSRKLGELESRLKPAHAEDLKTFQAKVFSEWNL